jgi:hypothetical protein
MPPDVLKFLYDIEQSCSLIEQFTAGKSAADFQQTSNFGRPWNGSLSPSVRRYSSRSG